MCHCYLVGLHPVPQLSLLFRLGERDKLSLSVVGETGLVSLLSLLPLPAPALHSQPFKPFLGRLFPGDSGVWGDRGLSSTGMLFRIADPAHSASPTDTIS